MTLLTLTMVTALAIGEVVLTTLMDIEFPNKFFPYELPCKRITLSGKLATKSSEMLEKFRLSCGENLMFFSFQIFYPFKLSLQLLT
jgi:hypothetical protein